MQRNYTAGDQTRRRVMDRVDRRSTGVNCQEATREKLLESLRGTLQEAIEFNRQDARQMAGKDFEEALIAA
jgi:hypothetical protein